MQSPHVPVMLNEVLHAFESVKDGVILDCTLGYGGHSGALLSTMPNIKIIACDRDQTAVDFCKLKFEDFNEKIEIHKNNFSNLINQIDTSKVRGILADIGVSSLQLDLDERGFALNSNELDMRMDKSSNLNAKDVVNSYSYENLARIFREYGELTNAGILASKIINAREKKQITSAKELAGIIGRNKVKGRTIDQAILVFQAIRIEVNHELDELRNLLKSLKNSNIDNAVLCVISFHSLEDKIVKNTFKEWEKSCICPMQAIKCECGNNHSIGKILTKKPLVPNEEEIKINPRSSCSKMRIFKIERQK